MRQNDEIQTLKLYVTYPTLNYLRYQNGSPPYHQSVFLGQFVKLKNSSPSYFGFENGDLQLEQSVFLVGFFCRLGRWSETLYICYDKTQF